MHGNNNSKCNLPAVVGMGLALVIVPFPTVKVGSWLDNVDSLYIFASVVTLNVNVDSN